MQNNIVALGAGLAKDCKYWACRLEDSNEQIFSGLARNLLKEGCQAKMNIYMKSQNNG